MDSTQVPVVMVVGSETEVPPQQLPEEVVEDPWALPELQDSGVPWTELTTRGKLFRICSGVAKAFGLILLLYCFVCSLDFLSSGFRLLAGKTTGSFISDSTALRNPIVALMLGVICTAVVQSSSSTTSIVITMVGSGLLEVSNAIPIIMGANIGTSITNTMVSFSQVGKKDEFRRAFAAATVHDMFNWLTVIVLLPVEVTTGYLENLTNTIMESSSWEQNKELNRAFLSVLTKPFTSLIVQLDKKVMEGIAINSSAYANASLLKSCCMTEGENVLCTKCGYLLEYFGLSDAGTGGVLIVVSIAILMLCLFMISKLLSSVLRGRLALVIRKVVNAEPRFPFNYLIGYAAIVIGCGMTILVQSSSIFTSALTPLAGLGVISIQRIYPLTLGSNIGTTTTGILAALAAEPSRIRYTLQIAFCHLFFNITGILMFYPVPYTRFPLPLAKLLGNTTAEYRWFPAIYLLLMFIVFPAGVYGLSMAGLEVFITVMTLLGICLALVIITNVIQRRRPSLLPICLQTWNWLPEWMHSLDPLDRLLYRIALFCKCCRNCIPSKSHDAKDLGMKPNLSRVNILQSAHDIVGHENNGFAWKLKAENTKL